MLALQITTAGDFVSLDLDISSVDSTLATLQGGVGGYIQRVVCPSYDVYVNENGQAMQLPANHIATELIGALRRGTILAGTILGDVVLTGPIDEQGDITALDPGVVDLLELLYSTPA